jgi:hypothetical protein
VVLATNTNNYMATLSEIFAKKNQPIGSTHQGPFVNGLSLTPRTQTLPNGGGTIQGVTPTQGATPAPYGSINYVSPTIPIKSMFGGTDKMSYAQPQPAPVAPVAKTAVAPAQAGTATPSLPSEWFKPDGTPFTAKEIVDNKAAQLSGTPAMNPIGAIPQAAGDALTKGPQTAEQLAMTAGGLNNARNDIATGATDPYKVGNQSGIAYSPAELKAIESAYAGIYDPAINSALQKLDFKQKADLAKEEAATKFKYDLALKNAGTTGAGDGTYTPGANKIVDSWAERIQNGSAKITEIPASQTGLRNQVTVALNSMGNSTDGKPTTTELGKAALATAKRLMEKVKSGKGTFGIGASRLWGAGGLMGVTPGTDQFSLLNDFNSLKSQMSLEGVKYLKGQGAVSDAERALLAQAVTNLNASQGDQDFESTLQGIIDKLEGNAGGVSQEERDFLKSQGITDEEISKLK